MSAKKKSSIPAEKSELYDRLIATHPKIERKGAAMGYTSLNGHMFSCWGPLGCLRCGCLKRKERNFLRNIRRLCTKPMGL